jgi:hypothetical protein
MFQNAQLTGFIGINMVMDVMINTNLVGIDTIVEPKALVDPGVAVDLGMTPVDIGLLQSGIGEIIVISHLIIGHISKEICDVCHIRAVIQQGFAEILGVMHVVEKVIQQNTVRETIGHAEVVVVLTVIVADVMIAMNGDIKNHMIKTVVIGIVN